MMEDLISNMDCRSKSDSIVMRILRSAMEKAHERLQFKDGAIEFLHERTTFYELAAILVEGGLNIVQEESEILESSCSKILSDLKGIRQWLVERIRAMKQLMMEKDSEFRERLETEAKLREALELKERESAHLYEKIEAAGLMNNIEGGVSTLKNSVDEQVLNIKQTMILNTPNLIFNFLDKEQGLVMFEDDDFGIKLQSELSSDVDILKRTIDLTEVLPLEKQCRRAIERDVESVLVKGFERDVQTRFDIEMKKRACIVEDSWFDFIDEMRNLFHELKDFFSRNDALGKGSYSSEPNLHVILTENDDDDDEVGGSPYVWKIIKRFESIMRRQRQQRSLMTRDALQREGSSSWWKWSEYVNAMDRRIQDAITRLENFTQRNHTTPKSHRRTDHNRASTTTIQSFESEIKKLQQERDALCFQISVTEDTYQLLFRGVMKDFCDEKEQETAADESEGSNSYQILLHYIESTIREDIYVVVFQETIKNWRKSQSDLVRGSKNPQEKFCCTEEGDGDLLDLWAIMKRFQSLIDNVDVVLHENLESKCSRLEALKRQIDELNQRVASIRTIKLLYEKAFISRCGNLKLAEIEVDLLGDQVETLVYLLERIYLVLNQNAIVLSHYFEVYEIMKLIEIELSGRRSDEII